VLPVDGATTVSTRVAVPVPYASGSAGGRGVVVTGGGGGTGRLEVAAGVRGVERGVPAGLLLRVAAVELGDVAGMEVLLGVDGAALRAAGWLPAELHAARVSSERATRMARRGATSTRPGCHATPMRMRGWAAGVSHRMIDTSVLCGIATHPAVGPPSVTCRKNALPAPARTPVGELRVL
jgi:hypothetical protein